MDVRRLLEGVLGSGGAQNLEREARRMMGGSGGGRSSGGGSGFAGGMMGGALSGGLINMVMGSKKGRKMGGKALKYGGAALLAGLAYKAWSDWKGNQSPQAAAPQSGHGGLDWAQPPASSGFTPDTDHDTSGADFRLALIRAMIAAAKCDGHIDREEHARIQGQIAEQNLSAEEKGFLLDAFSEEPDAFAIAKLARTPEQGAELYAASRLAIDPDVPAEHQYLERLAGALGLPRDLIGHLDAKVEAARLELGRED
jgi:uncharacterized membrane protein YebE (DUF533 family)